MTLTSWDLALAAIAAPEPESRFTSRSTFAPLVIACSACCCWVDLSPSAFWISDSTPAACRTPAAGTAGRPSPSARTTWSPAAARRPCRPPRRHRRRRSSRARVVVTATCDRQRATCRDGGHEPCTSTHGVLLLIGLISSSELVTVPPPSGEGGGRDRPRRGRARWRRAPRRGRRASRRRRWPPARPWGARTARATRARRRAAARRVREVAADDQQLRVEHVHERRGGLADRAPGVGDHAPAAEVALARQPHDRAPVEAVAVAAPQQLGQRVGAGDGLQAAAVAAAADRAVGVDEHVAELAGEALRAAVQAAVEHQPGADARRDHQVDEVLGVAPGAERGLGQRGEVGVVVDEDRQLEPAVHLVGGGDADPAGQDRGRADDAGRRGGSGRAGTCRRRSRAPASTPASASTSPHELGGGVEALVGEVVGVELLLALGEDPRREVRDRARGRGGGRSRSRPRRRRTRRRRAGSAGARPGRRGRRPARSARPRARRPAARRRGSKRSSARGPCGARSRRARSALVAQRVDHAQAVEAAQGLERPGAGGRHAPIRTDPRTFVKSANEPGRSYGRVRSESRRKSATARVRVDRHDDVVGGLVVPGLLLLVPQHPEVAEEDAGPRRYFTRWRTSARP